GLEMSQIVAKLLLGGALAVLLPSCYGTELTIDRHAGAVTLAFNFSQPLKLRDVAAEPTPVIAVASTDKGSVVVRGFHEPGDFAHRNYCGAGATQVLLSGWMRSVPDIETVAKASKLNPNRGVYGADDSIVSITVLYTMLMASLGVACYKWVHIQCIRALR